LLVVLAGYDADMDEMLSVNPGLKSRFAERIVFNDLSIAATRDLLVLKLKAKKISLSPEDAQSAELLALAQQLKESPDFSNGRDVETVRDRTYGEVAKRSRHRNDSATLVDVRKAVTGLLSSRQAQSGGKVCATADFGDQATATAGASTSSTRTAIEEKIETGPGEEPIAEAAVPPQEEAHDENPFGDLNPAHISSLQKIVEEMGLNSEEGVRVLLDTSRDDKDLVQCLIRSLGISEDTARGFLKGWREAHQEATKQKIKAKTKHKGMQAIWHCAVCGRGGQPQPVCYVAPYISSYRPIGL
jgi:hypothetical protein